jgi:hypothetical protein
MATHRDAMDPRLKLLVDGLRSGKTVVMPTGSFIHGPSVAAVFATDKETAEIHFVGGTSTMMCVSWDGEGEWKVEA